MTDEHLTALWYFGYGSNMHRSIFVERRRMHPLAIRSGRLEDYRISFNLPIGPGERGVANVEPQAGTCTWGVLYLLRPEECDRLDRTEGVHRGVYARMAVDVIAGNGDRVPAFTYRSSWTREGRKPSPRYLRLLVDGAIEKGLPAEYVRFLETFDLAWDERQAP
jgi:cation transport regulator ChaC